MQESVQIRLPFGWLFLLLCGQESMSILTVAQKTVLSAECWTSGDEVELHPFGPHAFFFRLPPGVFGQRKAVFLAAFYQLVYLTSIAYPQAAQHRAVHCPQLIDKTCCAVCCTALTYPSLLAIYSISICLCSGPLCWSTSPCCCRYCTFSGNPGGFFFLWKSSTEMALLAPPCIHDCNA